jgi:hypothetical protein
MQVKRDHARPDRESVQVVNHGIDTQTMLGSQAAARYMRARGVAFEVALRVLTRPAQRRK